MTTSPPPVSPEPPATTWPQNCAEASAVVFQLRRRGLPLLPGVTMDVWVSSVLAWSTGRHVHCVGLDEAA